MFSRRVKSIKNLTSAPAVVKSDADTQPNKALQQIAQTLAVGRRAAFATAANYDMRCS
jgi:hypothetical protein